MSEPSKTEQKAQSRAEMADGEQEGGMSMAPPAFQLAASQTNGPIQRQEVEGEPETPSLQWGVTTEGGVITLSVGEGESLKTEAHNVATVRQFVLNNYNWNGMVQIMTYLSGQFDDFTYTRPSDLTGNSSDNDKILPDKGIECIIKMQAKYAIETTYASNPTSNIDNILKAVDGQPKTGFASIMGTTYDATLDERDNDSMESGGQEIVVPELDTANEATLYDFLQKLVIARNGLWSTSNHITNIVGLRRSLETTSSKYNDTMFVSWLDGDVKHVKKYIGSTEPGDLDHGQLFPQTLTMVSGFHTGGSSGTPGGRTRNAFRKERNGDDEYFQSGDTTMNVHYGSMDIAGVPKNWGMDRNDDGTGEYSAAEVEAHATLVEIMKILTQWGAGKNGISAYHNLEQWARDFTRGEVTTLDSGDKQVTISDGQEGGKSSTLTYSAYTTFVDAQYNGKVQGKTNTAEEERDKAAAISILTYYHNQAGTENAAEVIAGLQALSLDQLREQLKQEAVWVATIDLQMRNVVDPTNTRVVDGKPGAGTVGKMTQDPTQTATETADFDAKKSKADVDWPRMAELFEVWDNNTILSNQTSITKDRFREQIKLAADEGSTETATEVDNIGGLGMNKNVGDWSEGCQVVMGGSNFYDFMHSATQYATETGQQRWYYTLIDIESLGGDVEVGPPAATTTGQ